MYKNFNLTDSERAEILNEHKKHGYKKPLNEIQELDDMIESASKWAKHGNENGYIYEITLKPTATIVENGTLNSNVVSVKTDMYNKLKSYKVDAIWSGNELNVLNKNAIQSFKPIFKFDYKTSKWIKL